MGLPLNIAQQALSRLLTQWNPGSGSGNIRELLTGLAEPVQELADTVVELITERYLQTAEGAQLDQYGRLVTEPRRGRNDADYLTAILARVATNRSSGTPEELIQLLAVLVSVAVVQIKEAPVGAYLQYERPTNTSTRQRTTIALQMQAAAPAGVPLRIVEANPGFFGFAGNPDALGFGSGGFSNEYFTED